jgi:hypothetical protein
MKTFRLGLYVSTLEITGFPFLSFESLFIRWLLNTKIFNLRQELEPFSLILFLVT